VRGARRIVAAARWGSVVSVLVLVALASSGAAGGRSAADVILQVSSRGNGTISATPVRTSGDPHPCTETEGQSSCEWTYAQGTSVRLTASAEDGSSFVGWSSQDCPGTGECTIELDAAEASVVAFFDPVQLGVKTSYDSTKGTASPVVTSQPAPKAPGWDCDDDDCLANFSPGTRVTLTAVPNGHTFTRWAFGCEQTSQLSCTVTVNDNPTWTGLVFDGAEDPPKPSTISVQFRLRKGGNGSGRVTAPNIDCGTVCAAKFVFGSTITVTASEEGGSTFDGWNGVCAKTQKTCTFAVGPITSIRALFARDTTAPSAPGSLEIRARTRTSISIGWTAATDNIGVSGYRVYLNDAEAGNVTATEYTLEKLACGKTYTLAVDATDAVGNRSPKTSTTARTSLCKFASRLVGVGVGRAAGVRIVRVQVRVSRATKVRLKLARARRAVAQGRYTVRPGTNLLRLRIPRRAQRGPYQLTVTVVNPDGGSKVYPKRVLLPSPR
jgi:hypothetical protein